jgi:hypothetical protein
MCGIGGLVSRKNATGRQVYRNRLSNWSVCLICGFATIAFYQIAVEAIRKNNGAVLVAFGFIMCAIFLIPTLREPFHGVVVTPTQVRVRNIMRTHVLSWDQIERFELAKYDPWPKIGVVVLRGGRRVPMVGVQRAPLGRFAENTVAALNERLAGIRDGKEPR